MDGLIRPMATGPDFTGPINIGNPHEIPVRELAERIIKLTNSRSKIVHRPLPRDDPMQRCPDITLATKVLGWKPKVSLDGGLKRTITYFDGLLRAQQELRPPTSAGRRTSRTAPPADSIRTPVRPRRRRCAADPAIRRR